MRSRVSIYLLQGDQGQCQAGALVEEEDERQVEAFHHTDIGTAGGVLEIDQATVRGLLVGRAEQLVVDAVPVGVQLVDALTANGELNLLDEVLGSVERSSRGRLLQGDLQETLVDQITVARHGTGHLLAEANGTVERVLDRLQCELRQRIGGVRFRVL